MKRFISILLTMVMLLGMVYVPAFAVTPDPVTGLSDDFETGILDTTKWRGYSATDNNIAIDTKASASNENNKAAKLSNSDGTKNISMLYNWVSADCTPIAFGDRAICEFDLLVEATNSILHLPMFQFIGVTSDGKTSLQTYEMITYDRSQSKLCVRQASNTKPASASLALDTWAKIRIDADFTTTTYKVYVNDVILEADDGMVDFPLLLSGKQINPDDIGEFTQIRIDTYGFTKDENTGVVTAYDLFWLDNVKFRAAEFSDENGDNITITGATVLNGETEVDLAPDLSYTFSHELNPDTIKNISLNNDSSYVKSATLSDDKKTLDIKLDRNLDYGTSYTLDFGFTEAAYGSAVTDTVTFTTLTATNLKFDNFEGSSIDTSKWRLSLNGDKTSTYELVAESDGSDNQVLHLKSSSGGGVQFDNYNTNGAEVPGDVLVEFKMMLPNTCTGDFEYLVLYGEKNGTAEVSTSTMLRFEGDESAGGYNIFFKDCTGSSTSADGKVSYTFKYCEAGFAKFGEWIKIAVIANPHDNTYRAYLNDVEYEDTLRLRCDFVSDKITDFRISAYAGGTYEIYLDDFKIARNMWLTEGGFYDVDGTEINVINPEDTVYKANIINRAPVAENMTLYLAKYTADGSELKEVVVKPLSIPAGKSLDVEHHFENLGSEAYTSKIKAIYVKNEDSIEPYRAALGLTVDELSAGTAPVDVQATLSAEESVASVYPGGKYKAVTMRFDDGKVWDKEVLEIMNENGLKGTFYLIADSVKNGSPETYVTADDVKEVYDGHEIGNHSWDHNIENISLASLTEAREYLESVWGDDVIGFAYPSSSYGDHGETAYKSYIAGSGHTYANMACVWDKNITTTVLSDIIDVNNLFDTTNSCRMKYTDFEEKTIAYADNTDKTQSLLFTMQHAGDFVTDGVFSPDVMNAFVKNIAGRDDIWYCTNGEVITYLMAQNEMNVPATGSSETVNKTQKTLYYMVGDELVEVAPGAKLVITAE